MFVLMIIVSYDLPPLYLAEPDHPGRAIRGPTRTNTP
jgi:hypothetical protein